MSKYIVAQKDGMLYIAGGFLSYGAKDKNLKCASSCPLGIRSVHPLLHINYSTTCLDPVLRILNLSKSFQISAGSASFVGTLPIPVPVPIVRDAAFFPTESGFDLTFGKWHPGNGTICGKRDLLGQRKKLRYEIENRKWMKTSITLGNWFQTEPPRGVSSQMTAWVPSLKKGFLFGGTLASVNKESRKWRDLEEHPGLITYDQATNTWTNETLPFGGIAGGGLVHITTSTDEVLIQLGGRAEWLTHVMEFSEIRIYSTNQSRWYTQRLPPDALVPAPRFAFCTALKSASDGSSHQIYIMGGAEAGSPVNAKGGPTVDSVWVLSIPSFEWTRLEVASMTATTDPRARLSPKCQAIGEHYIFLYGGRNALSHSSSTTCDKKANPAFLLDVNTLTWTDKFEPNEGRYEIPQKIVELIGGDKNGGSTKKAPATGWSDPDLETIMRLKTGNTSTPTRLPSELRPSSDSSKTNVGAIAGGTVGGVAAVLLGLLAGVLLRRRHQRKRSQLPPSPTKSPSTLSGTLEEGGSRAELMGHSRATSGGVCATELQTGDVAREMDT
ncbi:hypothetical protein HOY80DRAFT_1088815 [Tuber brumale]|nr:hypothetical protein HOY80DRAFT_1088815 [Tuber brumale]